MNNDRVTTIGSSPSTSAIDTQMEVRTNFDEQNEIWKSIPDLPEYSISSHGRVRKDATGQIMAQSCNNGYARITVSKHIHRLVAEAFIPKPDDSDKCWIDHINGDRSDNRIENLRWVTPSENCMAYGYHSRIKNRQRMVLATHEDGTVIQFESRQKAAEYFGCSDSEIVYNKVYRKNSPKNRSNPHARNKKGWKFEKVKDIV